MLGEKLSREGNWKDVCGILDKLAGEGLTEEVISEQRTEGSNVCAV